MKNCYEIPTPSYVLERKKLIRNLEILKNLEIRTGAKVLCALKGYAFWRSFDLLKEYLSGACASGLNEARLASELGGEVCTFSPAFVEKDFHGILELSSHIIFNSISQFERFVPLVKKHSDSKKAQIGLRLNPLYSEVEVQLYNPCAPKSRFGVTPNELANYAKKDELLESIDGLHFHTHCEQNSDALKRTLEHFESHFGAYIPKVNWVNFGGGHHITKEGYDIALLESIISDFSKKWGVQVYLEPGEAVGWESGFLISSVIDIIENDGKVAILDTSATAHMPDVLEMPYRPKASLIKQDGSEYFESDKNCDLFYRLGGCSCLSGDVIGDYDFGVEICIGDKIKFHDMMHYTIVKNTTFNGIELPNLCQILESGEFEILKTFGYEDYKFRN